MGRPQQLSSGIINLSGKADDDARGRLFTRQNMVRDRGYEIRQLVGNIGVAWSWQLAAKKDLSVTSNGSRTHLRPTDICSNDYFLELTGHVSPSRSIK